MTNGTAGKAGEGYVDIKPRVNPAFGSQLQSQVTPALTRVGQTLSRTGRGMQTFGRQATTFLTLPLVGAGVAAFRLSRDFGQAMANVDSIMQVSRAELERYSEQILDMSERLPQTATELADGLYDIASSGFQGAEGMRVLEASARAASAGMTNTETSARAITAVLNAYGLQAQDAAAVSDTLFKGVDKGVIKFEELASSIGDYIGAASQLEIPLQDVVAAQAAMTLSGISAFEAATSLNNVLRSLLKPSEDMSSTLQNMGFETGQAALESIGLQGIIEELSRRVGDNKSRWLELFPEIRAARGAMALAANDGKNLNEVMAAMEERAGATGKALERQARGPAFRWNVAMNRLRKVLIELGDALIPVLLDEIIPAIQTAAEWFTKLPDSTKKWAVWGGIAAAALGPIVTVLGTLVRLGGWILTNAGRVGAAAAKMGTTAATIPPPPGKGAPVPAGAVAGGGVGAGLGLGLVAVTTSMASFFREAERVRPMAEQLGRDIEIFGKNSLEASDGVAQIHRELGGFAAVSRLLARGIGDPGGFGAMVLNWGQGLDAGRESVRAARGELTKLRSGLEAQGVALSDAQAMTFEFFLRTGDLTSALNVLKGAIKNATEGAKHHANTADRSGEASADAAQRTRGFAGAAGDAGFRARSAGEDVAGYARELGKVPPRVSTIIQALGLTQTWAGLRGYYNLLNAIPSQVETQVITWYKTIGQPVGPGHPTAEGFVGTVSRPTFFLTGEGGEPEDVAIVPHSKGGLFQKRSGGVMSVAGGGGRLKVVEGQLRIDKQSRAWVRLIAVEEIEDERRFRGQLARMGRS